MGRLSNLLGRLFPRPSPVPHPLSPVDKADLVDAINKIRLIHGLVALSSDVPILHSVAQGWADSMAFHNRLNHGNFAGRITAAFPNTLAGENIAEGQQSVTAVMNSWMNSPLHRANILGNFNAIGVGIAMSSSGTLFWCIDVDLLVKS